MSAANDKTAGPKIAWITGASTGIGAATALRLAKDGWTVAATARSDDKLKSLSVAAERHSGVVMPFPGDVTDAAAMAEIVGTIESTIGPISLAILNAGVYLPDTLENFSAANLKSQYAVNVFGTANALEAILAKFKPRASGHIAIVASVAGYRGLPRSLSYGSSKAALINLTEALAIECEGTGIKVQVINPGFVKTPMTDANKFPMPMLMDVDVAADKLVRGLESNRLEITFPAIFGLATKFLGNIIPGRLYIAAVAKLKQRPSK